MNNFRGFSNIAVPIHPVNFLVGENSTGKTSFLALVELLSSSEFLINLDFNSGNYEFGSYRDIVSVFSDDQSEFQIGLFKQGDGFKKTKKRCFLFHFKEGADETPILNRISILANKFFATFKIENEKIVRHISKNPPRDWTTFSEQKCFEFLQGLPKRKFKYSSLSTGLELLFSRSPLSNLWMGIADIVKNTHQSDFSFAPFESLALTSSFAGMAPIRTHPKRAYDGYTKGFSSDGGHTPYVIRKAFNSKKNSGFIKSLNKYGENSGLYNSIGVTEFRSNSSAPFELTVNLEGKDLRINSVGYGVSQALPIVVETLTRGKKTWLAIQQPEVHLHPKAQAALGDVFFHTAINDLQTLFIETHSDFLIDRFRTNMRDIKHPDNFAQIIFFERVLQGNKISLMTIEKTGDYPENQPENFRTFFLNEQRRILGF